MTDDRVTEVRDWLTGEMIPVRYVEPSEGTALDEWDALAALSASAEAVAAELFGMSSGALLGFEGDDYSDAIDRSVDLARAIMAQIAAMTALDGDAMAPIRRALTITYPGACR